MEYQYLSKHRDRITLHVTVKYTSSSKTVQRTTEYRPVNGHYFNTFEKLRTMYRISPHYRCIVRIYEAYKSHYIDFVYGHNDKILSECPPRSLPHIRYTLYGLLCAPPHPLT